MSENVVALRPDQGPPSTDFEREAVESLLAAIRAFRAENGMDPGGVVSVMAATGDGLLRYRRTYYTPNLASSRMFFAFAAQVISQEALGDG